MKNKLKGTGLFLLILLLFSGVTLYFFRRTLLSQFMPKIEQIGVLKIRLKNDTSYIQAQLLVTNNTFLKIGIDSIRYEVSLFQKTYLRSKSFIGLKLPSWGKDTLDYSLKIPYVQILKDLKSERKKGDSASYSIIVSLQYTTLFGTAELPINKVAKIKIPQPPELEIVEIKYTRIRLRHIKALAKINIINHGPISLKLKKLSYSMHILKQGNLNGYFQEVITIKPFGITSLELPIEIEAAHLLKTAFHVMVNKDTYDYTLQLKAILETPDTTLNPMHIQLSKSGSIELKK